VVPRQRPLTDAVSRERRPAAYGVAAGLRYNRRRHLATRSTNEACIAVK